MNRQSIIRMVALLALAMIAIIGILCTVETMGQVVLTRAIGVAAALAAHRLYQQWKKTDPLIGAYDRWCEKCDR